MKTFVITAAGGNPTAIRKIQNSLSRADYERFGKELMNETENYGVEQAGFLIHQKDSLSHFEMSGGEFCGNAARSAALVLSLETNKPVNSFTMSGFKNIVSSHVEKISGSKFNVSCDFSNFDLIIKDINLSEMSGKLVDLGGIVHFVIEGELPKDYKAVHSLIKKSLNLEGRDAVGVVWITQNDFGVSINPIVWVKSIDTFFYETSCGSGSIAVAKVTGATNIIQPSGGVIKVVISDSNIFIESEMEITYEKIEKVEYILISKDKELLYKDKFISLYKDAFGGAPYFESYEDAWVKENVWDFHLKKGCIILAIHNNTVIGLGCAIPLFEDKKVFDFVSSFEKLPFNVGTALYMSELAVSRLFRKSETHIGTELVKRRIIWASENGFNTYVMRTAAENSNSEGLYTKIIGAKKILGLIQNISENPEEIPSASNERIFLYGEVSK